MTMHEKQQIDKFDMDYNKIASKEAWTKDDITMMKDLQKLMYYIEVRCAMREGSEYPGSDHIDDMEKRSYSNYNQPRNMHTGRYMSYSNGYYYDGEKEAVIHKLHRMMDAEDNPNKKMAIQEVIREFEDK